MDWALTREDTLELNRILEQANKTFLKESRINSQSSFNILRVLSSFRLLHPDSPSALYNAIIYITKIYNPQSLIEWQRAVNDLAKFKPQKQRNKVNMNQTSKYMKTYQNSYNQERVNNSNFQSKSYAQIKIPVEASLSHEASFDDANKDISQTNVETGKRQYYTKTDSITDHSKNHYISFEPYHQIRGIYPHSYYEKENVNSTNIGESRKGESAIQYIEAIRRDLNKTEKQSLNKTPIDQSFIKKIDSYESPYLNSVEPMDSEEEEMNDRAKQFLQINMKFKAFSSLLANTLALQKANEHRMKAHMQNKAVLLQRSFLSLKDNVEYQKAKRQMQEKATNHLNNKLKANVMKILKLLYSLRTKTAPIDSSKFNRTSYEFILTMLLSLQTQTSPQSIVLDFDSKLNELIENQEVDKVYLIIKYFGCHSWISQHSIEKLLDQFKKSILKKTFQILHLQRQQNLKYFAYREKNLEKMSFMTLKKRWQKSKSNKIKVMEAEGKRNRMLMAKSLKGLLEILYSTKLYSKRCGYLLKKRESNLKNIFLSLWNRRTKQKIKKNQILKEKIKLSVSPILSFYQKIGFRALVEQNAWLFQKESELKSFLDKRQGKYLIDSLKFTKEKQKKELQIRQKVQLINYTLTLSKWKESTRKGKAFKKMIKTIRNYAFRVHIAPELKMSIERIQIIEQSQFQAKKNIFRSLQAWQENQTLFFNQLTLKTHKSNENLSKRLFFSLLSSNYKYEEEMNKRDQLLKKKIQLQCFLLENKKRLAYAKITSLKSQSGQMRKKMVLVSTSQIKSSFGYLVKNCNHLQEMRIKTSQLEENYLYEKTLELVSALKSELTRIKGKKLTELRKKKALALLSEAAITEKETNNQKIQQSSIFYNQKILKSAFEGLRELIELKNRLHVFLEISQKETMFKMCSQKLDCYRNQVKIKRNKTRVAKKAVFSKLQENKVFCSKTFLLEKTLFDRSGNSFLSKMKKYLKCQASVHEEERENTLWKWIFVNRIKNRYVDSLMNKKYLFMAVKFRAIKICQKIFDAWKTNDCRPSLRFKSQCNNLRKANERLSTDFA